MVCLDERKARVIPAAAEGLHGPVAGVCAGRAFILMRMRDLSRRMSAAPPALERVAIFRRSRPMNAGPWEIALCSPVDRPMDKMDSACWTD
ncbi:MAG: hypothetical protein BIFFINMI_01553 [Phycisphaerae bacterium]|nr:hypothetical protein [Phycisphaerae bacterium]